MKYYIIYLLLGIFLLSSCGKKWKKPTHISTTFLIDNTNSGLVNISSGNITISEIDFNGTREQGTKNVSFIKPYDNGLIIPLSPSKSVSDITFDIPQGTYTEMKLNIKSKTLNNSPSLSINGSYTNTLSVTIPLVFNLDADENVEIIPKSTNGETEFTLVENRTSKMNIKLNPVYWFQTVTQIMLENADSTDIGGIMTIVISKNSNENIYNMVVNRIQDGNLATFD